MKPNARQTNQLQARHLSDRVAVKYRALREALHNLGNRPEPSVVARARHVVKRWEALLYTTKRRLRDKAEREVNAAHARVKERILFSSPDDALKAVHEFEKRKA